MRVSDVSSTLASPADSGWEAIPRESLVLAPVPLDAQPNSYIRTTWAQRAYGLVSEATVATARRGSQMFVRLEWSPSAGPNSNGLTPEFTDAAGVFFPAPGGTGGSYGSPATIGTRESPVTLWLWKDLLPVQKTLPPAKVLLASGPGVFRPLSESESNGTGASSAATGVSAQALRAGPRWAVVISGDTATGLDPGRMGVAIWDGSNDERSGICAVTHQWVSLDAG